MFDSSSYIFKHYNIDQIWNDYSSITMGYKRFSIVVFLKDKNIIYSFISTIIEMKKETIANLFMFRWMNTM